MPVLAGTSEGVPQRRRLEHCAYFNDDQAGAAVADAAAFPRLTAPAG